MKDSLEHPDQQQRAHKYRKLDPNSLIKEGSPFTMELRGNGTMILRRRGRATIQFQNQSSPSTEYEVVQTESPSFFPTDCLLVTNQTTVAGTSEVQSQSSTNHQQQQQQPQPQPQPQRQKDSVKDKIFSITTSGILLMTILSVGLFGFRISAQYSSANEAGYFRNTGHSGGATLSASRSRDLGANDMKQTSIDRFDSGGQIRSPLIRQPTTLAPMNGRSAGLNLLADASQDSYLRPEEHDQWLKDQESHYHSMKPEEQQQQPRQQESDSLSSSTALDSEGSGANSQVPLERSQLGSSSNQQESGEPDESDYEDESGADKANLVPEHRRAPVVGSIQQPAYNQRRSGYQHQQQPADEPSANLVDDYEGAMNDNEHFSRNPSIARDRSQLKQAASYNQHQDERSPVNQENNEHNEGAYSGAPGSAYQVAGQSDDSAGFGPSPNEAYMADRGEPEGAEVDEDENLSHPVRAGSRSGPLMPGARGGGGTDSSSGSSFDRRSMNDNNGIEDSMPYVRPISEENVAPQAKTNKHPATDVNQQAEPEDDQSEVGDEASGSALSSISDITGRRAKKWSQRLDVADTKASVHHPIRSHSQLTTLRPDVSNQARLSSMKQPSIVQSLPRTVYIQTEHNKPQIRNDPKPYNPQNNPSHAGKYFIN